MSDHSMGRKLSNLTVDELEWLLANSVVQTEINRAPSASVVDAEAKAANFQQAVRRELARRRG